MQLAPRHGIEALGRLPVTLFEFWTQRSGPIANGIGGEQIEHAVLLHPQLDLGLSLEYADENGQARLEAS